MTKKEKEKVALYGRVSTENQSLDNQEKKLINWAEREDCDYDLYTEKVSSIKERPKFEELMEKVDEYDKVVVTKIDRFGRSVQDMLEKINEIRNKGTEFVSTEQPINTDDDLYGDFMLKILSVIAEFERRMIRRRMEEGFEKAKEEGRVGRPEADIDKEALLSMYKGGASYRYLADFFDVSQSTIRNKLKEEGVIGERNVEE